MRRPTTRTSRTRWGMCSPAGPVTPAPAPRSSTASQTRCADHQWIMGVTRACVIGGLIAVHGHADLVLKLGLFTCRTKKVPKSPTTRPAIKQATCHVLGPKTNSLIIEESVY
jgi:hypothetical protein